MNKKLLLGATALVLSVGLFTGCGNKEAEVSTKTEKSKNKVLTCTQSEDMGSYKIIMTYDKDGEIIKEAVREISYKADDLEDAKEAEESAKEDCEDTTDGYTGVSCEVSRDGKTVTQSISYNFKKMDEDTKEELDMYEDDYTYEEAKEELEDSGWNCK